MCLNDTSFLPVHRPEPPSAGLWTRAADHAQTFDTLTVAVCLPKEWEGMSPKEIELDPVDFVTVGTVGPKGRRLFHLQAGTGSRLVTLIVERNRPARCRKRFPKCLTT